MYYKINAIYEFIKSYEDLVTKISDGNEALNLLYRARSTIVIYKNNQGLRLIYYKQVHLNKICIRDNSVLYGFDKNSVPMLFNKIFPLCDFVYHKFHHPLMFNVCL